MRKRTLWLINQRAVSLSDIPELISADYEVYTLKKSAWLTRAEGLWLTEEYDCTLSIDEDLKRELDGQDFLTEMPDELWDKINGSFSLVFLDYCPCQFIQWIRRFRGKIVLRLTQVPAEGSLGAQLMHDFGMSVFYEIGKLIHRFWYAPVFGENRKEEAQIIQRHYIHLPISQDGTPSEVGSQRGPVCMVCPEIKSRSDQEVRYRRGVSILEYRRKNKLDAVICGKQYLDHSYDPRVTGAMDETALEKLLKRSGCVLVPPGDQGLADHYVFAALQIGVPVVLSDDSVISKFFQEEDASSGIYSTVKQANKICSELCSGKAALRSQILSQQRKLLENALSRKHNHPLFMKGLKTIETSNLVSTHKVTESPRLAVLLLDQYSSDTILRLRGFFERVLPESRNYFAMCLGYPCGIGYEQHFDELRRIEEMGIPVREYSIVAKDGHWVKNMLEMKGYPHCPLPEQIFALYDRNTFFEDCSALLLFLNRGVSSSLPSGDLITSLPYGVCVQDDDIGPSDIGNSLCLRLQRTANVVLYSDEMVRENAIQRYGIRESNARLIPSLYRELPASAEDYLQAAAPFCLYVLHEQRLKPETAEAVLTEYYLRNGTLETILALENDAGEFRLLHRNAGQYLRTLTGVGKPDCDAEMAPDLTQAVSVTLPYFCSLLRRAEFVVLDGDADMHDQLLYWIAHESIPTICVEDGEQPRVAAAYAKNVSWVETGKTQAIAEAMLSARKTAVRDNAPLPDQDEGKNLVELLRRSLGL